MVEGFASQAKWAAPVLGKLEGGPKKAWILQKACWKSNLILLDLERAEHI